MNCWICRMSLYRRSGTQYHSGRNYKEPAGTAALTLSYSLPCDYVIHTVGPIVYDRLNDAFCCISTGEFHFPNEKAAEIAWKTVSAFLEKHGGRVERIIFNVFKDSDRAFYEKIMEAFTNQQSIALNQKGQKK